MKIIIPKNLMEQILINVQPFLERRDTTQIVSHVYIEASEEMTIVKATDNEIGIQIKTDKIIVHREGRVTANGKKLLEIIRKLKKDEDVILEKIGDVVLIKQQQSNFRLPMFNPDSFQISNDPNNPKFH